jgi:hypothetical protein
LESTPGSLIAIITHDGAVTFFLGSLGMDEEAVSRTLIYDHGNPLPPAGVFETSQDAEGQPWNLWLAFFTPPPILKP